MSESPVHAGNAPPGFEEQARDVVRRLRSAMTNLVSVAGADPTNARSMARKFGINKNLAWRVSNIIRSTDAIATVPYIPGPGGGNILLRAFTEAGAPIEQVALLRRSLNEFQSLVATHSADRETLEMMLGNLTHEGQRERDEAHRKLAYRGNSAIWGVRASAQYNCHLVAPSDRNDRLDHGRICGLMGFQRLRSNVRWTVSQIVRIAADGSQQPVLGTPEPIDPACSNLDSVPLLTEFCSQPLPDVNVVHGRGGAVRHEILGGSVGATASADYVTAWCVRRFSPRYADPMDDMVPTGLSALLITPAEWLTLDVLVHVSLGINVSRTPILCSEMPGGPPYSPADPEGGRLPLFEEAYSLGSPPDLVAPELPRCSEMVQTVCAKLGWNPDEFEGYRLRFRYPPIPTLVTIPVSMPEG